MGKQHHTTKDEKRAKGKHGKRAARLAEAQVLAAELTGDGKKKGWKKVAKLLKIDCCDPGKRKCKGCPLTKELTRT